MKALKSIILIAVLLLLAAILIFADADTKLYVAYAVFGVSIITTILFSAFNLAINFKENLQSILGAAAVIALLLVFYFISPVKDVNPELWEKTNTGEGWSAIIGAGLYAIYAFLGIFVLILVFFGVRNLIKN